MKYCHNCKIYLPDAPRFCAQCGASFDAKYCAKLHRNSPDAQYCKTCGSSDLSTPHRKPPINRAWVLLILIGTLLVAGVALTIVLLSLDIRDARSFLKSILLLVGAAIVVVGVTSLRGRI